MTFMIIFTYLSIEYCYYIDDMHIDEQYGKSHGLYYRPCDLCILTAGWGFYAHIMMRIQTNCY